MDLNDVMLWEQIEEDLIEAIENRTSAEILEKRDPFLLSDQKFIKLFRLTKEVTNELIDILTPFLQPPSRRSALSVKTKVGKNGIMEK